MKFKENESFKGLSHQDTELEAGEKKSTSRWLGVGMFLGVLFVVNIYVAVVSLGAHQLQHKLREISLERDTPVTVGRLNTFKERQSKIDTEYDRMLVDVAGKFEGLQAFTNDVKRADLNISEAEAKKFDTEVQKFIYQDLLDDAQKLSALRIGTADFENGVRSFISRYRKSIGKRSAAAYATADPGDLRGRLTGIITDIKNNIIELDKTLEDQDEAIQAAQVDYDLKAEQLFSAKCDLVKTYINGDNSRLISRLRLYNETGFGKRGLIDKSVDANFIMGPYAGIYRDVKEIDKRPNYSVCALPIMQSLEFNASVDSQVSDALSNYAYFDDIGEKESQAMIKPLDALIYSPLINMPQEMLTVMVVLAMGALGGTITMTRGYLDRKAKEPLANYIFIPLLGAITGFAVYVLAKAGVLIVAEGGAGNQGAYLSPFFISFLGLMSGMLSQDALDTILKIGQNWFMSSTSQMPRWAIGTEAQADNPDFVKDVANIVNASEDKVKAWLKVRETVPPAAQVIIAVKLDKQQRELFTDLAPSTGPNDMNTNEEDT